MDTSDKTFRTGQLPRRRGVKSSRAALAAGIAAPAILRITPAFAAYPERPVRIIVANTPGGPSDIIARIMAAAMQQSMGGSFFVENRGGAGGNIGMGLAARSDPDGYTILLTTSAYSVNPGLYSTLPYDPFKDFFRDLRACGLAARVRGQPRPRSEDDEGVRRARQSQSGEVQRLDAADRHHAAASGRGAQAARRLAGHGDGRVRGRRRRAPGADRRARCSFPPACSRPRIRTSRPGRSCGLAVTGTSRWHDLPEIPTMIEAGYKDFVFDTYTALMAPVKTPPEIVRQLEKVGARHPQPARDAREAHAVRLRRDGARTARATWRASPRRCRCSATSSPRRGSRSCSDLSSARILRSGEARVSKDEGGPMVRDARFACSSP